jgi:CMP/dCMP kinase
MIITIDGPAASGKSTVARAVAQELQSYYLSSGLLFRAVAYLLIRDMHYTVETISAPSSEHVDRIINSALLEYQYKAGKEHVLFKNVDITPELKNSIIDQAASLLSTHTYVRTLLVAYQRDLARDKSIVVDGRDTGSVVFPYADYKFFLTADLQERASRWQKDQEKRGSSFTLSQAVKAVNDRDLRDSQRTDAPLVMPQGAIVIDSTNLSVAQVVDQIVNVVNVSSN